VTTTPVQVCPTATIKLASTFNFSQPWSGEFQVATGWDVLAISFATNSLDLFDSPMVLLPFTSYGNTSHRWIDKLFSIDSVNLIEPSIDKDVPPCVRSLRTNQFFQRDKIKAGLAFSGVLSREIRNHSGPEYYSWEISGIGHLRRILLKEHWPVGNLPPHGWHLQAQVHKLCMYHPQ
jgi:hypothetical protein